MIDEPLVINQRGFKFVARFLYFFTWSFLILVVCLTALSFLFYTNETVEANGTIIPVIEVPVRAELAGQIGRVFCEDGQRVEKGDTLLRFVNAEEVTLLANKLNDLKIKQTQCVRMSQELDLDTLSLEHKGLLVQLDVKRARMELEVDSLLNVVDQRASRLTDSLRLEPITLRLKRVEYERQLANIKGTELERKQIKLKRIEFQNMQTELEKLEQEIALLRWRIEKSHVTAPISGTVVLSNKKELEGNFVREGQSLLFIAGPQGWELDARFSDTDIPFVRKGQRASINVTAFPYMRYRSFSGEVTEVHSAPENAVVAEGERPPIYHVMITISDPQIHSENKPLSFQKGLSASVKVTTARKRVIDAVWDKLFKLAPT